MPMCLVLLAIVLLVTCVAGAAACQNPSLRREFKAAQSRLSGYTKPVLGKRQQLHMRMRCRAGRVGVAWHSSPSSSKHD